MKRGALFRRRRAWRGGTRLDDLVAALDAGEIAGAGLDVFEREPLHRPITSYATMPGVLDHTAYRRSWARISTSAATRS